jgi:hypothetical protein
MQRVFSSPVAQGHFYCYSDTGSYAPGHQLSHYYSTGNVDNCNEYWRKYYLCLKVRRKGSLDTDGLREEVEREFAHPPSLFERRKTPPDDFPPPVE